MQADAQPGSEIILEWDDSHRAALQRAVLVSERQRMALVAGFVGVLLTLFLAAMLMPGLLPQSLRERLFHRAPLVVTVYGAFIVYELAARALVGRRLRVGTVPPVGLAYVNAALEISLPTVLIIAASHVLTPLEALSIPPIFIYPILITLLTLQLNPRVCAFAGAVGAIEYICVALFLLSTSEALAAGSDIALTPTFYIPRAGMILFAGLAAGFVAGQLRAQFIRSTRAIAQREHAIGIFGQHVSPQVAERLLSQRVETGPEMREVCVMFLDIRNFTAFADTRTPEEVMSYLNRLFGPMIDTVNRHQGIINKFLGDGFMAVFGAPVEDGQASRHAVSAAMELIRQVKETPTNGDALTRIGIGLHSGPAVTGNLGSDGRKEYTVIGGVVNLASRIEQLNKQYDSQVLASSTVVDALSSVDCPSAEWLGEVSIRGHAVPVTLFRLA